ncbi:hypothetical protein [Alistipes putredinis]|uniref:hypothetical protein n=1 Tax=Alistipes putredinis TaxID=28117 RepID=UPI003A8A91A3
MDKKSFIVGVKASIAEILERSTNKWVSVLEPGASFSAILAKNGLSPKITPPLFEVLTANGLIERLGDKSAIRYRYQPAGQITLDLDTLAEKVFDANQSYNRLKSGAVKQKRVTPPRDVNQNGKAIRVKGNILPQIGDSRYIITGAEGPIEIIEVKIVTIYRDPHDGKYNFDVVYRLPDTEGLITMERVLLQELHLKPEDIFAHLQRTMVRFTGELFPTIKRETVKQNGR